MNRISTYKLRQDFVDKVRPYIPPFLTFHCTCTDCVFTSMLEILGMREFYLHEHRLLKDMGESDD